MMAQRTLRVIILAAAVCCAGALAFGQTESSVINQWMSLSKGRLHPQDYGHAWGASGAFDISSDFGVLIGSGPTFTKYAYRAAPFEYTAALLGAIAIPSGRYRVTLSVFVPSLSNRWSLEVESMVSTYESIWFYGYGSDTPRDPVREAEGYYLMDSRVYLNRAYLGYGVSRSVWVGPMISMHYLDMYGIRDRLVSQVQSVDLGAARTYLGTGVQLFVDTRERSMYPRSGMYVSANSTAWFAADKGRGPFQNFQVDVRSYLTPFEGKDIVLALRAGGSATKGVPTYYMSAVLGGRRSLRGYAFERFRGDHAVHGSAELRFPLFKQLLFVPVEFGGFLIGDVGQLWYHGESPGGLRGDAGIGIWGAGLSRDLLGILYVAFAREGTQIRAGLGFDY